MHWVESAALATRLGAPHWTQKTSRFALGAEAVRPANAGLLPLTLKYFPHDRQLVEIAPTGSLCVPWQLGQVTS
jgi:hypothetical protein